MEATTVLLPAAASEQAASTHPASASAAILLDLSKDENDNQYQ
jgi:hypothetical protein